MELNINQELKELIPKLQQEEYQLLEKSIIEEGCRDSIIVWDNTIIDGHNRYEICTRNNIPFKTQEMDFDNIGQVKNWMIKNQLARRNLTDSQRRYFIGKRYKEEKKIQGTNNQYIQSEKGQDVTFQNTAKEIAEENNISDRTVKRNAEYSKAIDKIKEHQPEVAEKILNEEIRISNKDVITLSKHEPEEREKITEVIEKGEISINKAFQEIKKQEKKEKLEEKKQEYKERVEQASESKHSKKVDIENTDKKFRIIYADPCWSYNDKQNTDKLGGAEKHYDTMSIRELSELPVKEITEDDAVLFLWVTSPLLEESFEVIKAWGFKYKTSFIWDKVKHNMGHYNSVRHEFLLIATKGSCTPDNKKLYDSVQSIERTEHSAKPKEFMDIIDDLYVYGDRLEMFAREGDRENWLYWGNEI